MKQGSTQHLYTELETLIRIRNHILGDVRANAITNRIDILITHILDKLEKAHA